MLKIENEMASTHNEIENVAKIALKRIDLLISTNYTNYATHIID